MLIHFEYRGYMIYEYHNGFRVKKKGGITLSGLIESLKDVFDFVDGKEGGSAEKPFRARYDALQAKLKQLHKAEVLVITAIGHLQRECPHEDIETSEAWEEGGYDDEGNRYSWQEWLATCNHCNKTWHQRKYPRQDGEDE